MTDKQVQAALRRWSGYTQETQRLKSELARMQRWMDPKQTPGLSGVQRRRIRRKAQRYAESLENKLAVLMTLQRKWDRVLRRLPPLQGAILQMRYGEGLPWRKIAERTGYSEKHLFKLRRAAIERLSREEID